MKKFFWFAVGIGVGVLALKQVQENPKAKDLADDVSARAKDFATAIADGFKEREAELAGSTKPAAKTTKK